MGTSAEVTARSPLAQLLQNISRVIVGKEKEIRLIVTGLLSSGHVLMEDMPGVGKTVLVRALATSIGGKSTRIQFTPDLLPSDVTGLSVYNQKSGEFDFKPGPIFANLVLADEINRANPRTQAALLEAMAEQQITADGVTRKLEAPFMVCATQNPIEFQGTYPLPEAQLDRFLMRLSLGYPSMAEEMDIINRQMLEHPLEKLGPVISTSQIAEMAAAVRRITVKPALIKYVTALCSATRNHTDILIGASPRASTGLVRCAQAWAYISGRDFATPDDVKEVAVPVMAHRIILTHQARFSKRTSEQIIRELLASIAVPLAVA